jgi:hypothetical protein
MGLTRRSYEKGNSLIRQCADSTMDNVRRPKTGDRRREKGKNENAALAAKYL